MRDNYSFEEIRFAYIAGFFDGEGCVSVSMPWKGRNPRLVIRVNNTDEANIQFLADIIGGSFRKNSSSKRPGMKPVHCWAAYGIEAAMILSQLLPYLINKKERAKLGIECVTTTSNKRRLEIAKEMQKLNKKGVDTV